jgi:hypothetical protein
MNGVEEAAWPSKLATLPSLEEMKAKAPAEEE